MIRNMISYFGLIIITISASFYASCAGVVSADSTVQL